MTHISLTKPAKVGPRYSVTILASDGRSAIASTVPHTTRNGATVRAWTLANDIRAGRA